MQAIKVEHRGNVGVIFLNRPKSLNAWNGRMQKECFDALKALEADDNIRVIVITGSGRAFCAGADMGILGSAAGGESAAAKEQSKSEPSIVSQRNVTYPTQILKPIIAAINGAVAGIGLSFALACDMRFAAPEAKILGAFSRRGLVAEYGTSWTVPNLAGTGNAMMLLLSSDTFTGQEAFRMGIVQKCFPREQLLDRTVEYAQHLADKCSPVSMAAMKLMIWDHPTRTLKEATDESIELMLTTISGENPDFTEGVMSFLKKRPAAFEPLDKDNVAVARARKLLLRSRL